MSEGQLAALLIWLVLLAFSLRRSLWQTLHDNPLYQHLCLGSAIVLVPLWTLRAGLHEGLEIHFLGLTSLTLLLGSLWLARALTGAPKVHAVGYCIGGTALAMYMAWANRRFAPDEVPVADFEQARHAHAQHGEPADHRLLGAAGEFGRQRDRREQRGGAEPAGDPSQQRQAAARRRRRRQAAHGPRSLRATGPRRSMPGRRWTAPGPGRSSAGRARLLCSAAPRPRPPPAAGCRPGR